MNISKLISQHEVWRRRSINLVASENRLSPSAAAALTSDMGHRYFFKTAFETESGIKYDYRGATYISEMYEWIEAAAKRLFGANYVNLEMLSGHLANINILFSHCRTGDTIICTDTHFGGYPGLDAKKLPAFLGLNVEFLPQSEIGGDIDLVELERLIQRTSPKIVMLSSSMTFFPFPVKEVSHLCHQYGVPFCYDASHPLGLIAGGMFQSPFEEGADYIIGSTHKSFPGPQGGIVLGKADDIQSIEQATDFVVVDNIHLNRIAALGITIAEMEAFGKAYAQQIIANAKAFAHALVKKGFDVAFSDKGFTQSHQFLLNSNFGCYSTFTAKMESIGIILDNSGRIGVSEITRLGMKEEHMSYIADLFSKVASVGVTPDLSNQVAEFMQEFQEVQYCFDLTNEEECLQSVLA